MQRIRATLAYDGAGYAGWQIQAKSQKPPSIQGLVEQSLQELFTQRIIVHGAGRTDAGVHAQGQVCHFDVPIERKDFDYKRYLNAKLPTSIRIIKIEPVSSDFHARKSAIRRAYTYSIWCDFDVLPRMAPYCWGVGAVDRFAMEKAAEHLLGTHDFASFQNAGTELLSTVRTVYTLSCTQGYCGDVQCPKEWPVMTWTIVGNSFLRQMVRNIIGLLVWVGRGKIDQAEVPHMLASCFRANLPSPTAPAHGLIMAKVLYP